MNNRAPDLSPEARRIIDAARGADDPTAEDHARVKTRWLAGVAAVAGVSSLTEAARAAGGVGWGLKAVGAALAVVAGAIGLYVAVPVDDAARSAALSAGSGHERHEKTSSASPSVSTASERRPVARRADDGDAVPNAASRRVVETPVAEPVAATPPGEPEISAPAPELVPAVPPVAAEPARSQPAASLAPDVPADRPAVEVSARPARERAVASRAAQARPSGTRVVQIAAPQAASPKAAPEVAPATGAAASASGQLGEELNLLSQVRSSVQDGAPQRALELLAGYEARFGKPILEMEADALRVDALCRAGQREAAQASAAAFQNEWPGSPLGSRVSAACP